MRSRARSARRRRAPRTTCAAPQRLQEAIQNPSQQQRNDEQRDEVDEARSPVEHRRHEGILSEIPAPPARPAVPKTRIAKRPVKEKEQFFVKIYLERGATSDKIAACEKRACLKKGSGKKILARKSVKAEIKAKTEPILSEQMRQSVIGDSYEAAKIAMQRELALRVS